MLCRFVFCLTLMFSGYILSQDDTSSLFTFSGYAELYYSFDFSNPSNHEKPSYIYNYKRHNELNINLAFAKINYSKKDRRANIALMMGNYSQYNMADEPTWAQFVYEANMGFKISKKHNLWLDFGIIPSHIGFESVVGKDCWNVTRSLLSENSPFYFSGAKLSYINKKETLQTSIYILNGWQKIQKHDHFDRPSFGIQINYKPSNKITLNYSNFIGSDKPDSVNAIRQYHNFYAIYDGSSKWGFILGFDLGGDKYNNNDYGYWYSPVAIVRYKASDKLKIASRVEYFQDTHETIIKTIPSNGFSTLGGSLNLDYLLMDNILWRIEGKWFHSTSAVYGQSAPFGTENFSTTTSLCLKL